MPKTGIVTGVNTGIGKATAIALAEHGFDLGMTWLGDELSAQMTALSVEAAGRRAFLEELDLSDSIRSSTAISSLADRLGGLDVMVNNAGGGHMRPFLQLTLDEWDYALRVNLTGAFICGQAAARRMIASKTRGRIVNITSIQAHVPHTGSAAYCAAKAGLSLLTKTMALELGPYGITVNEVAPGEIATALTGMEGVDPATVPRPHLPLRRPGHPREVADLVVWLLLSESNYATGSSFVIDGGCILTAADLATSPE